MKPKLFILLLVFGLITYTACQDQPASNDKREQVFPKNDCRQVIDTVNRVLIPYAEARQNILSYDSICKKHWKTVPVEAYTIRAIDLLAALGLPPEYADSSICRFKHVRVYMGYQNKVGFKLYILPVTNACLMGKDPSKWVGGDDVLLDKNGNPIWRPIDSTRRMNTDDEFLLDLNAPCPNTCPQRPFKDRNKAL